MGAMVATVAAALQAMAWENNLPANVFDDAERIARAAIAAMRKPTEAMVDDGIWALPAHSECVDVVKVYNAMIDAALPEVAI